ncbi:PRECURSOR OF CEP5 [Salix koriyanagi]|uniref:PRECURSOR OF CEP5 n=1 Tax=Salix koriyanagi TaxID=2511006 RepID=A0A9Q0SM08_9ROSI|nr:PRECURSOR OF CEP5 [Salix koriyanagi]
MAETCKNALFILALVTCFQILLTEGRPIKSANKQQLGSSGKESMEDVTKQGSLTAPPVTRNPSVHHSKAGRKEMPHPTVPGFSNSAAVDKDAFRPTTPGVSPGVGHPKTIGTKSNNEHSLTDFKDDFQPKTPVHTFKPTTPGHSPGIGHLLSENESEDIDPKAADTMSSSGDSITAFKQKIPGDSPGISHTLSAGKSEITAPKAFSVEHSVTEDFQPTVPGHSPGVGHVFQNTNEERKP